MSNPRQYPLVLGVNSKNQADQLIEASALKLDSLVVSSISAIEFLGLNLTGINITVPTGVYITTAIYYEGTGTFLPKPTNSPTTPVVTVYNPNTGTTNESFPYAVNTTGPATAVSLWTYQGLKDKFFEIPDPIAAGGNIITYNPTTKDVDGFPVVGADAGYVLGHDGAGHLTWVPPATGNISSHLVLTDVLVNVTSPATTVSHWTYQTLQDLFVQSEDLANYVSADPVSPGDIIYVNGGGDWTTLAIGDPGEVLKVVDGYPSWEPAPTGTSTVQALNDLDNVNTFYAPTAVGQVLRFRGVTGPDEWVNAALPHNELTGVNVNVTSPATAVSHWTYQGLQDLFVEPSELSVYATTATTALVNYVRINLPAMQTITGPITFNAAVCGIDALEIPATSLGSLTGVQYIPIQQYVQFLEDYQYKHVTNFNDLTGTPANPSHWRLNTLRELFMEPGEMGIYATTANLTDYTLLTTFTQATGTLIPQSTGNALGDLIYFSASPTNKFRNLPIGSDGQVLKVVGGLPTWATAPTGTSTVAVLADLDDVAITSPTSQHILRYSGATGPSAWINTQLGHSNLSGVVLDSTAAGQVGHYTIEFLNARYVQPATTALVNYFTTTESNNRYVATGTFYATTALLTPTATFNQATALLATTASLTNYTLTSTFNQATSVLTPTSTFVQATSLLTPTSIFYSTTATLNNNFVNYTPTATFNQATAVLTPTSTFVQATATLNNRFVNYTLTSTYNAHAGDPTIHFTVDSFAPNFTTTGTFYSTTALLTPLTTFNQATSVLATTASLANYTLTSTFNQATSILATTASLTNYTLTSVFNQATALLTPTATFIQATATLLPKTGGTITGPLVINSNFNVTGNVVITGTTTFVGNTFGIGGAEVLVDTLGNSEAIGAVGEVYVTGFGWNNATGPGVKFSTNTALYLQQLDGLLYKHVFGYVAPTGTTAGHWTKTQITDALTGTFLNINATGNFITTANLVTRIQQQVGLDDLYDVTLDNVYPFNDGDVLSFKDGVWINAPQTQTSFWDPSQFGNNIIGPEAGQILILSGDLSSIDRSLTNISSVERHLSGLYGVPGSSIHHHLSSLDQRYVNVSGDTMTGDLNVPAVSTPFISGVDYIQFDTNVQSETAEGRITWDDTFKTLIVGTAAGSLFRLGQEVSLRVRNKTGSPLYKGQVVYVSGVETNLPTVALASASAEASTHKGMGILKQDIPNNNQGLMMLLGKIFNIDTSIYSPGDVLYLGTTPGSFTNVYAQAPNHPELIGAVLESDAINGSLLVTIQHGYEINELHNVSRTPASATGQVLVWNDTSGYYQPGSHNDLAGLTSGNPHTQYATLSGATFTGQVLIPSGSSVAPGLAFSNSTNTGLIHTTNRLTSVVGGINQFSITTGGAYDFFSDSALLRLGQVGDVTLSRTGTGTLQISSSVYVPLTLSAGVIRVNPTNNVGGLIYAGDNGFRAIQFGSTLFGANGLFAIRDGGVIVTRGVGSYSWENGSNNPAGATIDLSLFRDAANTLAQRNSANAQTFRIYNTHTDASNYERAGFNWNSNTFEIETEAGGTGVARNLTIGTSGTPRIFVASAGNVGIRTSNPVSPLTLSGALTIYQSALNGRLYDYRDSSGNNLYYSEWDGSNFHHYFDKQVVYNLASNAALRITSNGTNTGLKLGGTVSLWLDPPIDGSVQSIRVGAGTYTTSAIPLGSTTILTCRTWAWNGSNGYTLASDMGMTMKQTSAVNESARFTIYNVRGASVKEDFNILTNGNVGIGSINPSAILHIDSPTTQDLLNLHNSGISRFRVSKDGEVTIGQPTNLFDENPVQLHSNYPYTGFSWANGGYCLASVAGGVYQTIFDNNYPGLTMNPNLPIQWGLTSPGAGQVNASVADLKLYRDAANTLAQRNNANSQTFRIYDTYTDASNYVRGFLKFNTAGLRFQVGTESSGTGASYETDIIAPTAKSINLIVGGTKVGIVSNDRFSFDTNAFFGYSDLRLFRDAAHTLAQRSSTNAQAFRLYNTYTDASNYERAALNWNASAFEIETEAEGTGIARDLIIGTSGTPRMIFSGTGARIDTYGTFVSPIVSATSVTAINGLTLGSNQAITGGGTRISFNLGGEGIATVTREGTKRVFSLRSDGAVGFNDGTDPANTDSLNTFISRASQGVLRATSSIEALSSITANIRMSTPALSATNISGVNSLSSTNITGVNTYATLVSATNISAVNYYGNQISKSISIINPSSTENITIFNANEDYEIVEMVAVLRGSSTPSITWTVRKDPSRAGTGTEVVTGGTTTTSTTTGSVVTSFNSNTVPNGNFVWLAITAKSGTVDEYHLTVHMRKVAGVGGV